MTSKHSVQRERGKDKHAYKKEINGAPISEAWVPEFPGPQSHLRFFLVQNTSVNGP